MKALFCFPNQQIASQHINSIYIWTALTFSKPAKSRYVPKAKSKILNNTYINHPNYIISWLKKESKILYQFKPIPSQSKVYLETSSTKGYFSPAGRPPLIICVHCHVKDICLTFAFRILFYPFFLFFSNYEAFSNNLTFTYLEKYYILLKCLQCVEIELPDLVCIAIKKLSW